MGTIGCMSERHAGDPPTTPIPSVPSSPAAGPAPAAGVPQPPPHSPQPGRGAGAGWGSGQGGDDGRSGEVDGEGSAPGRRVRRPALLLAAVAVAAAVIGGGTAAGVQELTGGGSGDSSSTVVRGSNASSTGKGAVSEVADAVGPSVVEIESASGAGGSTGSGVVTSEDGEILTNNHVVSGSDSVKVTFSDGRSARAEVLGTSPDHDLALIKAQDVGDLTAATLGDSDEVGVGDQVVAIGSPGGLSGTVTSGIVSATNREVTVEKDEGQDGGRVPEAGPGQGQDGGDWPFEYGGGEYNGEVGGSTTSYKAIQTDASLNPGNSGGALVDLEGKVVGINSAMYSSSSSAGSGSGGDGSVGLGFAIPVNDVKGLLEDMRSGDS